MTGALDLARGGLTARGSVTVASNVRTAGDIRYDAGYGHGATLGLDASYRIQSDTRLLLRFRGGAHDPASVAEAGFEWAPGAGSGELAGTPVNLPGPVNAERLPSYARLDLGVRREWHFRGVGRGTVLTTGIALTNALDRPNVLGLVAGENGRRPGAPRSASDPRARGRLAVLMGPARPPRHILRPWRVPSTCMRPRSSFPR